MKISIPRCNTLQHIGYNTIPHTTTQCNIVRICESVNTVMNLTKFSKEILFRLFFFIEQEIRKEQTSSTTMHSLGCFVFAFTYVLKRIRFLKLFSCFQFSWKHSFYCMHLFAIQETHLVLHKCMHIRTPRLTRHTSTIDVVPNQTQVHNDMFLLKWLTRHKSTIDDWQCICLVLNSLVYLHVCCFILGLPCHSRPPRLLVLSLLWVKNWNGN